MTKEGGNSLPHKQATWGGQGSSALLSFCLSCLSWRILSLPAWPKLADTLTLHPGVRRTSRYLLRIWPWSYCSVAKLCLTLWDPVDCSQAPLSFTISPSLLTFVSVESMMPSNHLTLSPPSPPAINLSQHQGLFQGVSSSHQVAKVLKLQHQSFQWKVRVDFLEDLLVWSPCSPRDSQEASPTPDSIRKHQFFGTQPSLWSNSHICSWLLENIALTVWTFAGKVMSLLFNTPSV